MGDEQRMTMRLVGQGNDLPGIGTDRIDDLLKSEKPEGLQTFGLALSGGGIRSATFNLGIIQALIANGILPRVDFLSTVSGGGYIGGWLSAFLNRHRRDWADPGVLAQAIAHLRRYSNYLTPRYGVFSHDTLAAVATLVRNLLLNQVLLVTFLLSALLLPLFLEQGASIPLLPRHADLGMTTLLLFAAAAHVAAGLMRIDRGDQHPAQPALALRAALLGLLASIFLARWMIDAGEWGRGDKGIALGTTTVLYGLLWLLAWLTGGWVDSAPRGVQGKLAGIRWIPMVAAPLAAGAALGGLLIGYHALVQSLGKDHAGTAFALAFGTPLLLLAICLAICAHIGVGKRWFRESMREWLGRAGGICISLALGWTLVVGSALYGAALIFTLRDWLAAGGLLWLATTVGGMWLARSDKTGGARSNPWLELVAQAAPYVFVIGLLVALSALAHVSLQATAVPNLETASHPPACMEGKGPCIAQWIDAFGNNVDAARTARDEIHEKQPYAIISAWSFLVALCAFLAWRIDINLFSMHQFYCNRLTRCYLGASRKTGTRRPNAFTDFDFADDLRLARLARQRPIPLVNCALNLTAVKRLQWQQRMATAFVLSPHRCGYRLDGQEFSVPTGQYMTGEGCKARSQRGPYLGSAISASGAAANPNQGYHTSPALAFIMTFFNVRLGRWVPNPWNGNPATPRESPVVGLGCLLRELFAATSEETSFVNISDGGHFENLGLYELVRRKCRLIVACDAGCDPAPFTFEDLGNAVRKCRVDLKAEITIDLSPLTSEDPEKRRRFAIGTIDYGGGLHGTLVYLKPLLTDAEPPDIHHYHATHPKFPQEPTSDQWFDEAQFESYRKLGEITGNEVFAAYPWTIDRPIDAWIDAVAAELAQSRPTDTRRLTP